MFFIHKFYVGHVDVHHPFQEPNDLCGLISGAVINNGKPKTPLYRFRKRSDDLRGIVGGSDKVDVVATHFLEPHHGLGHLSGGDPFTISQMADVVILAKNTPKITVGEEDGP
jgi:hypothetical protein